MAQTQESGYPEVSFVPSDPEMFQRVWNRVMSRGEQEPAQPPSAVLPIPLPTPELPTKEGCEGMCFGTESLGCAQMLREMLEEVCLLARDYRTVLRQVQGGAGRQVRCLVEDQQRQLKQMEVLYFLLTGERFVHSVRSMPVQQNVAHGLRELFLREQQRGCVYQKAAEKIQDICIKELLEEFSEEARLHANMIRKILEGL